MPACGKISSEVRGMGTCPRTADGHDCPSYFAVFGWARSRPLARAGGRSRASQTPAGGHETSIRPFILDVHLHVQELAQHLGVRVAVPGELRGAKGPLSAAQLGGDA